VMLMGSHSSWRHTGQPRSPPSPWPTSISMSAVDAKEEPRGGERSISGPCRARNGRGWPGVSVGGYVGNHAKCCPLAWEPRAAHAAI
jgi:hypothetical protein